MKPLISTKEIKELMALKGEVKGTGIKTHGEFVLKEEGVKGVKKLEDALANLGYPIKFEEIKSTDPCPFGVEALILLTIQRIFGYDDKKFNEMGRFHAKSSLIIRLFMKYFVSLERMAEEGPRIWKRYFSQGNLKAVEVDKQKKRIIFRVENFYFHPLHCQILKGSIPTIVQMVVRTKISCQETKCVHRGDQYHEFLMEW